MLLGDLPPPLLPPYTVKYSSALLFTGRRKTSSSRVAAACFMVECDDESFSFYFGRHGRGRPQRSMWPFTGRWPNLTPKPHLGRIDLVHSFSLIMSIVYVRTLYRLVAAAAAPPSSVAHRFALHCRRTGIFIRTDRWKAANFEAGQCFYPSTLLTPTGVP